MVKQKRALLASPNTDLDEKFALGEQIATIYKDKLLNPQKAIAAHMEALNSLESKLSHLETRWLELTEQLEGAT